MVQYHDRSDLIYSIRIDPRLDLSYSPLSQAEKEEGEASGGTTRLSEGYKRHLPDTTGLG